jgi:hypothetical protein
VKIARVVELSGRFLILLAGVGGAGAAEFQVNQYTTSDQRLPSISHESSGGLVVAWASAQDGSSLGVFARRYDSSGSALGVEFQVNEFMTSNQRVPWISHDSSGGFAVAWESFGQDGSGYGVFGRRIPAFIVIAAGPGPGGASLVRRYQRN